MRRILALPLWVLAACAVERPPAPPPPPSPPVVAEAPAPIEAPRPAPVELPQPPPAAPKAPTPPPPASKPAPPPPATPTAPPALDLAGLEQRLRDTKAIGVFTKLAVKNDVDDLLDRFRAVHEGSSPTPLAELRQPFNLLILKILALLQDSDPGLARAIAGSRDAIWSVLADKSKFIKL
ncbi:MAG TPA: hypothetical protein VFD95_01945 [Usitatibacter sp.]|nr:hypothetical protein [Usitatibacter sp.]